MANKSTIKKEHLEIFYKILNCLNLYENSITIINETLTPAY